MAVFPIHNILVVPDAYIYFKAEYYRQNGRDRRIREQDDTEKGADQ